MTQCDTAVEACTIDACGTFVKEYWWMLNFYKTLKWMLDKLLLVRLLLSVLVYGNDSS